MTDFAATITLADRAQTVQLVGALVAAGYEVENPAPRSLIVTGVDHTTHGFATTLEEYLPNDAVIDDCKVVVW